jgi:hypothetical protein
MRKKEPNLVVLNVFVAYIIRGPHVEVQTHHLKQKMKRIQCPLLSSDVGWYVKP